MQCRGEGGVAPFKKNDVILRARPQTAWRPKDLVLTELFLGQRGAITRKSAVNCRKSLIKHFVCTFYSQHKQNHCVILKLHSDFTFSYIFSFWCSTDHFDSTATRKEQFARHEILRRQGSLRAPPQDDIVSFEGGCAPFTPALRVRT